MYVSVPLATVDLILFKVNPNTFFTLASPNRFNGMERHLCQHKKKIHTYTHTHVVERSDLHSKTVTTMSTGKAFKKTYNI